MATNSSIEWTDATWNPVAGCSIVSPGCTNCYAMRTAHRFSGIEGHKYEGTAESVNGHPIWTGKINLVEKDLDIPLHWTKPQRIFVNSMSDLFHEDVPFEFIDKVFAVMALCPQHTYQVLSKRPEIMARYINGNPLDRIIALIHNVRCEQRTDTNFERAIRDRLTGADLAYRQRARTRGNAGGGLFQGGGGASVPKGAGGISDQGRIPSRDGDHQQAKDGDGGAPDRMDVPQQANSERADDQSLGRDKGQQPSKESKTRDVQGAEASRIECAPPSKMAPNRIASSQNAPDGEGCVEDSEHEGSGNHGEGHRSQFRHDAESDISDMLPQDLEAYLTWPLPNVWLGTSAERQKEAYERIPHLLKCPAVVRFLSCEPLLSGIDLSKWIGSLHDINRTDTGNPKAKGGGGEIEVDRESIRSERPDNIEDSSRGSVVISWIICGGESGPGARPMHPDWARSLRDQCQRAGVPFFFKQWGAWIPESEIPRMPGRTILGTISGEQLAFPVSRFENHCGISFGLAGKKNAGRLLDGREWNEMPETAGIAP